MSSSKSSVELYIENRMEEYINILNKIVKIIPECHSSDNSIFIEKVKYSSLHDREKLNMFVGNCYERYADKIQELKGLMDEVEHNIRILETCVKKVAPVIEKTPTPIPTPLSEILPVKSISPKNKTISQKVSQRISPILSPRISPKTTLKKTRKTTKSIPTEIEYPNVTETTIDTVINSFNDFFEKFIKEQERIAKEQNLSSLKIPVVNKCCTQEERDRIRRAVFIAIQGQPKGEISEKDSMIRRRDYLCIQYAVVFYYFIFQLDETRMSYKRLLQLLKGYNKQNLSEEDKKCIINYVYDIINGNDEWASIIRQLYMGKSIKYMENKKNMSELKSDLSSETLTQYKYFRFDKSLLIDGIETMNKCATNWIKKQEPSIRKDHEQFPEFKCCSEEEIEKLKIALHVFMNAIYVEGEPLNMYKKFLNYYVISRYYALRFFEREFAFSCYDMNKTGFDEESITYMKGIMDQLTYGEEPWINQVRNILGMPTISRNRNPGFKVNSKFIVDTLNF